MTIPACNSPQYRSSSRSPVDQKPLLDQREQSAPNQMPAVFSKSLDLDWIILDFSVALVAPFLGLVTAIEEEDAPATSDASFDGNNPILPHVSRHG